MRRVAPLLEVLVPVALLGLWAAWSAGSETFYYPPLTDILETFNETWLFERVGSDVVPSLLRLGAGYAIAVVAAVLVGIPLGLSRTARSAASPIVEFLRAIPPPALLPVFILIAGLGDRTKVLVIAFGCVWPILLNTVEGVRGRDEVLSDTCRSYGIDGGRRLWHLVLRSASPRIVTGARQALAIAIIVMVISEMIAANNGLGFTVLQFQRGFQIPEMWSGVLLLGLIGVVLAWGFRLVEARVLGWYYGQRAGRREW